MKKTHLISVCFLLATLLVGCDFTDDKQPGDVPGRPPTDIPGKPPATIESSSVEVKPAEPLILDISSEMIEPLPEDGKDFLAPHQPPATTLESSQKERNVSFSGKVHLDDKDETPYRESVEGGEVNVEVKFK